ncbi:MAG: Rrf2 family transcriptional regulator [Elusimicrobia bacterium]|nr:Rrf2 family transcriptional regulator [Elusimicrobiota bacterium]
MKLITKQTDYAVRALGYLSGRGDTFISSSEIARAENIPASFLRRIMQVLIKAGIVAAREGKNGGVRLAVNPATVRMIQLIELFQGKIELSDCMVRKDICPNRRTCALRTKIQQAERRLFQDIGKTRLSELI